MLHSSASLFMCMLLSSFLNANTLRNRHYMMDHLKLPKHAYKNQLAFTERSTSPKFWHMKELYITISIHATFSIYIPYIHIPINYLQNHIPFSYLHSTIHIHYICNIYIHCLYGTFFIHYPYRPIPIHNLQDHISIHWVGELLMHFQHVAFQPSQASFPTTFLINCGRCECLRTTTYPKTVTWGESKGMHHVKH